MATNGFNDSGNLREEDGDLEGSVHEVAPVPSPQALLEEAERKARVDAAWEQMNRAVSVKMPKAVTNKPSSTVKKTTQKVAPSWMTTLGLAPKMETPSQQDMPRKRPSGPQTVTSNDAKLHAAAALSTVKDSAAVATGWGKVEVTEVRDFAGEEIEVKKLVDADSKDAAERTKGSVWPPSAVDAILEQIKKKPKLSVLDKTKKDWGEFKEEKGLEEELDAYKKSSNQYLEKVSFLQRTDYREFERERDVRLALQAKRRPDMREEP